MITTLTDVATTKVITEGDIMISKRVTKMMSSLFILMRPLSTTIHAMAMTFSMTPSSNLITTNPLLMVNTMDKAEDIMRTLGMRQLLVKRVREKRQSRQVRRNNMVPLLDARTGEAHSSLDSAEMV